MKEDKEISKLNIWTSYHQKEIPQEYNIKENDNIKLFYTNDLKLKKDNINYLNKYYGELCTMYYVWKNEKSEYVGFQHYRFYLTHTDLSLIENNICSIIYQFGYYGNYYKVLKRAGFNDFIIYKCIKYISEYLHINENDVFNELIVNDHAYELPCNTFICKWETFDDICKFVFGLLTYLLDDYKNELNIVNSINNFKHIFNIIKNEYYIDVDTSNETERYWALYRNNGNRYYIHLIEFILGFYIYLKYKNKIYINLIAELKYKSKHLILNIENKNININDFIKFYKYNIFTGIQAICIYNYKNTTLEKYINSLEINKFNYIYKYVKLFDNENELSNYLQCEGIEDNNIYRCNINEYIDVKSPIDFYTNNNYEIKNIK